MADLLITTRVRRPPVGQRLFGPDNRELTEHELRGLAGIYWPSDQVDNAVRIAQCESAWNTGAWAYSGEDSRGLWQLNVDAHPQMGLFNLFDPMINAYFAEQLWREQGWRPWSCARTLNIT